jgi:hypothetical protein
MVQSFSVLRAQDAANAAALLVEITPKNWHRFPGGVAAGGPQPAYVRTNTWNGGLYGDDVTQAESNVLVDDQGRGDYGPRNQAEKATALGKTFVQDVGAPRGWITPDEPYNPAPVSPTDDPTVTSLAPNTAVAGAQNPVWVTITGTKFTPFSTVESGGVYTPYHRYVSPTKMSVLMDAPRSVAGTVTVRVIDHGVKSATGVNSNFTFT